MRVPKIAIENHAQVYDYYGRDDVTWSPVARGLSRSAAKLLSPTITFMPDVSEELDTLHERGMTPIIAFNHPSAYDPFVTAAAIHDGTHPAFGNPAAIAKASLHRGPLGPLFRRSGTLPVFRASDAPDQDNELFRAATDNLIDTVSHLIREGRPVGIMPEGTRHPEGFKRENLKSGIARVALSTAGQSYIVPGAIVYRGESIPRNLADLRDSRRARVVIGHAISGYTAKDEPQQLLNRVYEGTQNAITFGQTGRL